MGLVWTLDNLPKRCPVTAEIVHQTAKRTWFAAFLTVNVVVVHQERHLNRHCFRYSSVARILNIHLTQIVYFLHFERVFTNHR